MVCLFALYYSIVLCFQMSLRLLPMARFVTNFMVDRAVKMVSQFTRWRTSTERCDLSVFLYDVLFF